MGFLRRCEAKIVPTVEKDRAAAELFSRYGEKAFGLERFAIKNRMTPSAMSATHAAHSAKASQVAVRGSSWRLLSPFPCPICHNTTLQHHRLPSVTRWSGERTSENSYSTHSF